MERETPAAEDIRITGENARCDEACKRLLSTKEILAHILKACVEEYIEGEPQVSEVPVAPDETNAATVIHGISAEDVTQTEGTVTYDIRFLASLPSSEGKVRMILNVEGQNLWKAFHKICYAK